MLAYLEDRLLASHNLDDWMTFLGIALAFHFMLRVSEYCADGQGPHALRAGDLLYFDAHGHHYRPWDLTPPAASQVSSAIIDVRSGKVDKDGRGRHLYLDRHGPAESRLLDLMLEWSTFGAHTDASHAFLSHPSLKIKGRRKYLTRRMVSGALKTMARHFGFTDAFFSTHSLRIGGMSCGTAAQMSNVSLCRIAGWDGQSEALYRRDVPDRGIFSALDSHQLDTSVTLLSAADVRRMIPTALHSSFGIRTCNSA